MRVLRAYEQQAHARTRHPYAAATDTPASESSATETCVLPCERAVFSVPRGSARGDEPGLKPAFLGAGPHRRRLYPAAVAAQAGWSPLSLERWSPNQGPVLVPENDAKRLTHTVPQRPFRVSFGDLIWYPKHGPGTCQIASARIRAAGNSGCAGTRHTLQANHSGGRLALLAAGTCAGAEREH